MKIKKKYLIMSLVLIAATLGTVGCGKVQTKQTGESSSKKLRIAIQPAASYAPLYVAKDKGWLEADLKTKGVTVEWTSFASGPPENESFAAKQQDIGVMGDVPGIVAKSSGQKTKIIGISAYGPKAFGIVVPKDSKITKPSQLKGKKVALVIGSYAHHLLYKVLEANSLTDKDISIINMGIGDMKNALIKKEVDAAVMWEPNITKIEDSGVGKVLVDGTNLSRGDLLILGREDYISANPEIAEIFLKAYKRGSEYIASNPDEASKLIAKDFTLTPEQLKKVLPKYVYSTTITNDAITELKESAKFLKSQKLIRKDVDIDQFIDTKYLKGAGIQ